MGVHPRHRWLHCSESLIIDGERALLFDQFLPACAQRAGRFEIPRVEGCGERFHKRVEVSVDSATAELHEGRHCSRKNPLGHRFNPLLLHFRDQSAELLLILGLDRNRYGSLEPGNALLLVLQGRLKPYLIFGIGLPQFAEHCDPICGRRIAEIHPPPAIQQWF